MNELMQELNVENLIYEIRGKQVMLDSDLAKLYKCANGTKTINLAVNRHHDRFPNDFYFQLNEDEINDTRLRFQFETLNKKGNLRGKHIKYLPYVFTEQGVAMLATVLRTPIAAQVSINIMRAFVKMRHYINYNKILLPNRILLLEDKVDNNTKRINELFDMFDPKEIVKNHIFYEGDFYDAYSFFLDILNIAKKEIILVDNYASKELLDILRKIKTKIIIVSKNIDEVLKNKYQKQYTNISFINNKTFHDRFIIIDRNILYSCGSSFKDLGKKCFVINKIDNKEQLEKLLEEINSIDKNKTIYYNETTNEEKEE